MALNFQASLYGPVFATLGVPAQIYAPVVGVWQAVTGLDKTDGIDVGEKGAQTQTIKPVVKIRIPELAEKGIKPDDLALGCKIDINGYRYSVDSYKLDLTPNGRGDGVVLCIVSEDGPVEDFASESESESE